jgi:hypothetical protein
MSDGTYQPKTYRKQGGDEFVVAPGGKLTIEGDFNFDYDALTASESIDGGKFAVSTEVKLGTYANALNGKLDFGAAGSVTGLGGAICAELDLGPGTTSGSYACYEAELNIPASGSLGTRTSFFSLNAWGANVAAFDTGGHLFDLNGVTANTGKMFSTGGTITNVNEITAGLRVLINGVAYRILMATETNFGS